MDDDRYHSLESVISDPLFPCIDHRLRCGFHVDSDDIADYEFLLYTADWLQGFYAGYQCRLIQAPEGYWYLRSEGDLLGHRRLSLAEMLVGQVLALMRMDPVWLSQTGWIPRTKVLETLEHLLGRERLASQLAPRSRAREHHADDRRIREAVDKALNGLEALGFVRQRRDTAELLPRRPLMRFVAAVRGSADPREALERLVLEGEVEFGDPARDASEAPDDTAVAALPDDGEDPDER